MLKRKVQTKSGTLFDHLEDEFLIHMAFYEPQELLQLCMLAALDYQMLQEQKSYDNKRKV
jgi:hypothetical protein